MTLLIQFMMRIFSNAQQSPLISINSMFIRLDKLGYSWWIPEDSIEGGLRVVPWLSSYSFHLMTVLEIAHVVIALTWSIWSLVSFLLMDSITVCDSWMYSAHSRRERQACFCNSGSEFVLKQLKLKLLFLDQKFSSSINYHTECLPASYVVPCVCVCVCVCFWPLVTDEVLKRTRYQSLVLTLMTSLPYSRAQ